MDYKKDLYSLLRNLQKLQSWYVVTLKKQAEEADRESALLAHEFVGTSKQMSPERAKWKATEHHKIGYLEQLFVCQFFHKHFFNNQFPFQEIRNWKKKDTPTATSIAQAFKTQNFSAYDFALPTFWTFVLAERIAGIDSVGNIANIAPFFELEKTKKTKSNPVQKYQIRFFLRFAIKKKTTGFIAQHFPERTKELCHPITTKEADGLEFLLKVIANFSDILDVYHLPDQAFSLHEDFLFEMVHAIKNSNTKTRPFMQIFETEKRELAIGTVSAEALRRSMIKAIGKRKGKALRFEDAGNLLNQGDPDAVEISEKGHALLDTQLDLLRRMAKRAITAEIGDRPISNKIAFGEIDPELQQILSQR